MEAPEAAEQELTCDFLLGDEGKAEAQAAAEEKVYRVTKAGRGFIEKMGREEGVADELDGIRRVKSKFSSYSLRDLIRYVYTKYPEWAAESEIRDKIL